MDEPELPTSPEELAVRLRTLRQARRDRKERLRRDAPIDRGRLTERERAHILGKTAARCHICGGKIEVAWQADHVLAHSSGGSHAVDNYLPAHRLCNNYRWDYSSEEFQWILKIGVWARTRMEKDSELSRRMLDAFHRHDARRLGRRRPVPRPPSAGSGRAARRV